MNINIANAKTIENELNWFLNLVLLRGKISFERSLPEEEIHNLVPPELEDLDAPFAQFIKKYDMGMEERLVLILALIPHVKPSLLDILNTKNQLYDVPFTEFGGIRYEKHKGYLPTGETAIFLLAGTQLERRFELLRLFDKNHFFYRDNIITLERTSINEPMLNGQLSITQEYLSLLITGKKYRPNFSKDFPAMLISTKQEWDDLIVNEQLLKGLEEIRHYIEYGKRLKNEFEFGKKIKPGFKVLFTGPPGTGKTMAATLLGKSFNMDVYKIDLSLVFSKYIGETEKNLSRVFERAEANDWILFFDEADALFGKRTNIKDAPDRYANQEVSFLLQRMEDFDGLVILCSNFKQNIDEAFFRRFQLILDFDIPDFRQRQTLWKKSITKDFKYHEDIDLEELAEYHEITAASIVNILHYCILKCLSRKENVVSFDDIMLGIKIEKVKEGKSIL